MTKIGGVLFSARRILFVFAVAAVFFTVTASAQTTEFTYQGNLKNGGVDANGSYDFEFGLFTALSGGFQLGSTLSVAPVTVTDGVFTVKLDFGNQYSSGSPRFLEIRVRQTGGGGFVTLSPRQQINSAPFAVKSLLSDTAATASTANSATTATTATNSLQLGGVAASQYVLTGDARLSDARTPLANSPNYVQNTTTQQTANFNVSGNGTVGGTLSANAINTSTQLNIGGIRFVTRGSIPSGFNTFVGEESGTANLGTSNAFYGSFSGQANVGGASNSFFGYSSGNTNTSGSNNAFFGRQSGEANTTGNNNSFFGRGSGNVNMTGSYNSFFGHTAGLQNTSGTNNTAIGSSTDFALPNLVFATAIGSFARAETDNTVVIGKKAGIYDGIARPADKVIIPGQLNVVGQLLALLPAGDPSYIQNAATLQAGATFNVDGDGRVGGILTGNSVNSLTQYNLNGSRILGNNGANNLFAGVGAGSNTTGGSNAFFGASSGSATTTGLGNSFFGMGTGAANTTGSNNTLVGNAANLGAGNLTFATAIGAGSLAAVNNSVVLGRAADQVQIPGSLAVSGPLTGTFTIPTANLTGIVSIANGGTGLGAVGGVGTFLRSNGSIWQAATLVAGDVPSGSTHYIQNSNSPQASSNFNISGDGTAGGTLSANIVNSTTQYRIAGDRILSVNGASNVFLGSGTAITGSSNTFVGTQAGGANSTGTGNAFFGTTSGSATTTGTSNSFFGNGTGIANILGSNNTAIGAGANMGANNLTFATAVGAGAVVGSNNTVTLGRAADTVQIPGNLSVAGNSGVVGNLSITGTLTAGTFSLPATSITGILPISKGGTGQTAVGSNGTFLRSDGTLWAPSALAAGDIPSGSPHYVQNGTTAQAGFNFNVGGTGTANIFNAGTQFNIATNRVLSIGGTNNLFAGVGSGSANPSGTGNAFFGSSSGSATTTGSGNAFFGFGAGVINTLGSNNTALGSGADFSANNLSFATAIGSGAVASLSNSIYLGRAADTVRIPGGLNVSGAFSGTFTVPVANLLGVVPTVNGGTGVSSAGTTGNVLRSNAGVWQAAPLLASDLPSLDTVYIRNNVAAQTGNFNITGNGIIGGNLNVAGTLTANIPASSISSGTLPIARGGTGQTAVGANGSFLRSDGSAWAPAVLVAGDIPSGSPHYVQNGTTVQAGFNFNVGGTGTANIFNAGTQFNIATNRVLSIGGTNNLFTGVGAGSGNTTGGNNAFFGSSAGAANTTGSNNTAIGESADVGSGGLSYATAIGSDAVVSTSNSVVLGRAADTVRIPGNLNVTGTITAPSLSVSDANFTGTLSTGKGGTGLSSAGSTGNFLKSNAGTWTSSPLVLGDIPSLSTLYINNNGGLQAGASFNIGGNGAIGGNLNVTGTLTAGTFNLPASSITSGTLPIVRGGTGLSSVGGIGTFLRSDGSAWQTALLTSGDIPAGSPHYIQNGITPQAGFNFNVGGNGTIGGNLSVAGTFTGSIAASSITSGTLGIARGGTGLSAAGGIGTFLRSDGSTWSPATLIAADIPSLSNTYITTSGTLQPGANLNIGGNGAIGGNLNVTGTLTAGTFSLPASSITTGTLGIARGGTGLSAAGGIGTFLRSDGSAWSPATLIAADIPSLSNTYLTTSGTLQPGANLNIGGNGTIGGNLTVTGTLNAGAFSLPASSITSGTLPIARGGTGLSAAGGSGTFLKSNGSVWSPATLIAGDIPAGSAHYVQNGTTAQAGFNFNVGGNGTIGGNGRILGDLGIGTPAALTTLDVRGNGFFGLTAAPDSPASNAVYVNNDGGDAANSFRIDASGDNLAIAGRSATGAGAGTSITFRTAAAEGGEADRLKINANGTVVVNQLGAAGATALCMNASNELATCAPPLVDPRTIENGGTKTDKTTASLLNTVTEQQAKITSLQQELSERKAAEQAQKERIDRQQAELDALKRLVCAGNSAASICKQ